MQSRLVSGLRHNTLLGYGSNDSTFNLILFNRQRRSNLMRKLFTNITGVEFSLWGLQKRGNTIGKDIIETAGEYFECKNDFFIINRLSSLEFA